MKTTNKEIKYLVKMSKFLSLVLRHKPETINIQLDENGWTDVKTLIAQMQSAGKKIDQSSLIHIVENNNKKRFGFNKDKTKIRANQGHSIAIELGYIPQNPPAILYHGTAKRNLDSIFEQGLNKRSRHHVHLSRDIETAKSVGRRYGQPIVLKVNTLKMFEDGHIFYESENGVWLTEQVPPQYLSRL